MFVDVEYNGKKYCVMTIYFKKQKIPILIDEQNKDLIKQYGKDWKCNSSGIITIEINDNSENNNIIKLHKLIVMKQYPYDKKSIFHLNKMRIDNREENLKIVANNNINTKKRKRYLKLPDDSDITPDEIPSYVWYSKAEGTHGDRFIIRLQDIFWKSTSSKKVSLRFKLEETKNYLRLLKKDTPELFDNISMNGDYDKTGEELLNSFYDIIYKAGFNHIKRILTPHNTDDFLHFKPLTISIEKLLFSRNIIHKNIYDSKEIIKILPHNKYFKNIKLPDHVYYRPESDKRSEHFIIRNHPKYTGVWTSSTSKKISLIEKYNQLIEFMDKNNL
jgi:hypothetical protein